MTAAANQTRQGFPWILSILALGAFAILMGLGSWQVQRLEWKNNLIGAIDTRLAMPPVPLDEAVAAQLPIADQEYRPVTLSGTFQHQWERHFFATHKGATGYFVYTPLLRAAGDYVWVNRGFVPYELKDATKRAEGQVTGPVEINGLLREAIAQKPSSLVPDNDLTKNIFYWKDIRGMSELSGMPADANVLGLFVDADDAPNPGGLPVGGVTLIDQPNNHLQYAITWYGIAAGLVGVYLAWILRWRRTRAAHP